MKQSEEYCIVEVYNSKKSEEGYFDGFHQFIFEIDDVYEDSENKFLVIGDPGVDGIQFVIRRNERGLWAFYPIGSEYKFLAYTVDEFLANWKDNVISI